MSRPERSPPQDIAERFERCRETLSEEAKKRGERGVSMNDVGKAVFGESNYSMYSKRVAALRRSSRSTPAETLDKLYDYFVSLGWSADWLRFGVGDPGRPTAPPRKLTEADFELRGRLQQRICEKHGVSLGTALRVVSEVFEGGYSGSDEDEAFRRAERRLAESGVRSTRDGGVVDEQMLAKLRRAQRK